MKKPQTLIPGGVNSPARAFGAVGGSPPFFKRAEGAYLFDIDGNRYLDYVGSWGPMILGHAHPAVVEAVTEAARRGTSFGAPTEAENELAERIVAAVPSVEMVRLVNSGTEATMSAIRLARDIPAATRSSNSPATTTGTSIACWSRLAVPPRRSAYRTRQA